MVFECIDAFEKIRAEHILVKWNSPSLLLKFPIMKRLAGALLLISVLAGCKSVLQRTVKTPPVSSKAPIVGYGTDLGKVIFYVEKYLPFEDVPSNIVEIRGMTTTWYDSSNVAQISYTIWFSDTGYVAKDPDSTRLYVALECDDTLSPACEAYRNALIAAGYEERDPDTTFRMKLLFGTTSPGDKRFHQYTLPQDAVDLMDRCLLKGGLYELIQISIDNTTISDTLYIDSLVQAITVGIR